MRHGQGVGSDPVRPLQHGVRARVRELAGLRRDLGDEDLNTDTDDQLVTYLAPDRVAEVSSYLAEVTESEFGVRYDAMPLDDRNPEYGSDERGYAWGWLQEVADFFQRAARERRHVVFTVRF